MLVSLQNKPNIAELSLTRLSFLSLIHYSTSALSFKAFFWLLKISSVRFQGTRLHSCGMFWKNRRPKQNCITPQTRKLFNVWVSRRSASNHGVSDTASSLSLCRPSHFMALSILTKKRTRMPSLGLTTRSFSNWRKNKEFSGRPHDRKSTSRRIGTAKYGSSETSLVLHFWCQIKNIPRTTQPLPRKRCDKIEMTEKPNLQYYWASECPKERRPDKLLQVP